MNSLDQSLGCHGRIGSDLLCIYIARGLIKAVGSLSKVCVCVYIYTEREREIEREMLVYYVFKGMLNILTSERSTCYVVLIKNLNL